MSFKHQLDHLILDNAAMHYNTPELRQRVMQLIENLIEAEPTANDYAIICDETNNTPERIAAGELWCDVAVRWDGNADFTYYPRKIGAA